MPQPDLQQQLTELTATVKRLTERVATLEGHTVAPQPTFQPTSAPTLKRAQTRTITINPIARRITGAVSFFLLLLGGISPLLIIVGLVGLVVTLAWPWTKKVTIEPATAGATTTIHSAPVVSAPRQPSRFEQDLARHWFSWLGIISLVVGVTLLLNYAFRGFGPIGRIFTGYAAAGMLFGLWFWLRKMYQGFAFVLQSGAWALVYISTYALHVVGDHPVSSPVLAGYALFVAVAIMIIAALLQRSKTLTAGAFFLGYITALTNTVDLFTLLSLLILSVGVVIVAMGLQWTEFIVAGTVATYIVQMLWMLNQSDYTSIAGTAAALLIFEVLVFGAAHWMSKADTAWRRQFITLGSVLNLLGFYWLFHLFVNLANNQNSWLATMFLGLVCALLAAATLLVPTRRFLRPVYIAFGVGFITLALGQQLHGDSFTLALLIESTAIVCLGTWTNERTLRYSGYVVSLFATAAVANTLALPSTVFGTTTLHSGLVLGVLAALCLACSALAAKVRQVQLPKNERFVSAIFADAAIAILLVVFRQELAHAWVPVIWISGALLLLGFARRSINGRIASYTVSFFAALYWLTNVLGTSNLAGPFNIHAQVVAGIVVAGGLGLMALLLQQFATLLTKSERSMRTVFAWTAVIMTTIVLGAEIAPRLLSVAWGIEGVLLFLLGFARQNTHARRQGLMVLGLTIAKVYIIDIQTLATPYKILSFIILGCILLGVGFLYNRWRQRPKTS